MPDYHDIFWKMILARVPCAIEFLGFLLKEKAEFLDLENLRIIEEIIFRKKKIFYDFLYEISLRDSKEKLYFLIEHKSRRARDFELQMMKYKKTLYKWQKQEFGKLYSIIPILFFQGLDVWDPERELEEVRNLKNPILPESQREILIFNLSSIDPIAEFSSPEMKAGMFLLKIIINPWNEFLEGWIKIQEILSSMERAKRIELEEEMLDYIFRSRIEENAFLEEAIMGKKVLTAYERAFEDGKLNGEQLGELRGKLDTARRMVDESFELEQIIRITGLSEEQFKEHGILL